MMGGHSAYKQPNAEELEFFLLQRAAIEEAAGHAFQHFEVVHFTQQVVAGMIYQVNIKVADGEHIHVKIFKPLPHTGQPAQVQVVTTGHAHDAPFNFWSNYFLSYHHYSISSNWLSISTGGSFSLMIFSKS